MFVGKIGIYLVRLSVNPIMYRNLYLLGIPLSIDLSIACLLDN
jgi:hypothetical protein